MSFPLQVGMQANLDQLEKDFDKAADMAGKAVEKIEEKFKETDPSVFITDRLQTGLNFLVGGAAAVAIMGVVGLLKEANNQMTELANNAKRVGASTDEFQGWAYALRTGGASAGEAAEAIKVIGEKLNEIRRSGENDFTKMLDANGQKWKDQQGEIIGINEALGIAQSLIRNAATELDKIDIGKHLGLSEAATNALDRMPGIFDQVSAKARAAGAVIDEATIQKGKEFAQVWNDTALQWETRFKSTIVNISGAIDGLISQGKNFSDWLDNGAQTINQIEAEVIKFFTGIDTSKMGALERIGALFQDKSGATFAERFPDDIAKIGEAAKDASPEVERLFNQFRLLFQLPEDQTKIQQLIGDILKLTSQPIGKATVFPKGDDDDDKKDAFDTASDRIERRRKLLEAEAQAIGQVTRERERARAIADLDAAAERTDEGLTEERKKQIQELAGAYAEAANKTALAKQHFEQMNSAITYGGDEAIRVLDGLRTGSLNAAQAVRQLENSIITMLERAALLGQGPLAGLLGTAAAPGTGTGGILGALFGGFRAGGGDVESGRDYIVGEEGPEVLRMGANGTVLPNHVVSNSYGNNTSTHFHAHLEAPSGSFDPAAAEMMVATLRRGFQDMATTHMLAQSRTGGVLNRNFG
jgi:hypothetical protein